MPNVSIAIHAAGIPDFATSDDPTIAAVRASLPAEPWCDTWLVPAHELAATLRTCGRKHWAAVLEDEEEPHVVTVNFTR